MIRFTFDRFFQSKFLPKMTRFANFYKISSLFSKRCSKNSSIFAISSIFAKTNFSPFSSSSSSKLSRPFILGIESSCDDTGAAVIDGNGRLLGEGFRSQQVYSSRFGGVIPELAQNLHETNIGPVVDEAMRQSGLRFEDLDAIAVTRTPGMVICLRVGVQYALDLCRKFGKPLVPIHHMQAHALTIRMPDSSEFPQPNRVEYPFLCLLVSGGHCILAWVKSVDEFLVLGHDIDGAPGEAFDKTARQLRLRHLKPEYDHLSGGVLIEKVAREGGGDPLAIAITNPSSGGYSASDCNFSFSGIKTHVSRLIQRMETESELDREAFARRLPDICASFQHTILRHVGKRLERALVFVESQKWMPDGVEPFLVVSGGVAANSYLRTGLAYIAAHYDYRLISPPPRLCTDNGIMIAWNGLERFKAGVGIIPAENVPDTMWVDARTPLGPQVPGGEIRAVRRGKLQRTNVTLTRNFYDPSHLETAVHYSEQRIQRRRIEKEEAVR